MSWLVRVPEAVPNPHASAFRQSATEIGVEKLATSTGASTTLAGLCFNRLGGIAATSRGLLLGAKRGMAIVSDSTSAKEFALAHWLVGGTDGGRLLVRVFDGAAIVRENIAGDVLASITTMQWNGPAKGWDAGVPMDDANSNRRQTIRVGAFASYAQGGMIGFDGPIDLQSHRLYGLPEASPAVLNGAPLLPQSGQPEFAADVSSDPPSLVPEATSLIDVTVSGARAGELAQASLVSPTRLIELDAAVSSNNTVRVMARNISGATVDLAAAKLSVGVMRRRAA